MLREYVEFRQGLVTVLLGLPRAIPDLLQAQRLDARVAGILRGMVHAPGDVRRLRTFLVQAGVSPGPSYYARDKELIGLAIRSLQSGRLRSLVIETVLAAQPAPPSSGSAAHKSVAAAPASSASVRPQPPGQGLPGHGDDQTARKPKPVGEWSFDERFTEVVRRTGQRVPREAAKALQALLTPENIAMMAAVAAAAAALHLTPVGWVADAGLAGLAFYYGGMAAIEALKNLVEGILLTANARHDRDLNTAADELAAAVTAMGTVAIVAILRRASGRSTSNSGSGASAGSSTPGKKWDVREPVRTSPALPKSDGVKKVPQEIKKTVDAAPSSPLAPGGGLKAHEKAKGHLLEKHVGKSQKELAERLVSEPKISGSSSFKDRATAEKAVSEAIDANNEKIAQWLSGSSGRLRIDNTGQNPVGISVTRGVDAAESVSSTRLILVRDPSMSTGYRILTGFPTKP